MSHAPPHPNPLPRKAGGEGTEDRRLPGRNRIRIAPLSWTLAPLGIAALALVVTAALAQVESEPSAGATSALVMVDGRLIEGRIERTNEGYMVHQPGSKFLLLSSHVRVHGKDRRDAYLKLRRTYPLGRPDPHVELARWCVAHGLLDDARRELREALRLAPNHAAARALFDDLRAVAPDERGGARDRPADVASESPPSENGGIGLASAFTPASIAPGHALPAVEPLDSRVLVTLEGRIVEGRITRNAGGYQIERTGARFVIPDAQVRVEAADRSEAFDKIRSTLPPGRPEPHVALARWCIGHQMRDEARVALLHALRLDPANADARSTLKRLEESNDPRNAAHLERPAAPPRTADGFDPPAAVSLAGLTPETAEEFVVRVQPLLMNKCGNAACHGSVSDQAFRLEMVRPGRGAHRAASERNLAAVLRRIDRERPERSTLLTAPEDAHDRGRPVFRDHNAPAQREVLSEWVRKIAADMPETPTTSQPVAARPAAETRSPTKPSAIATAPPRGVPARPTSPRAANSTSLTDADEKFLEDILREERPDAFDPEEFNRLHRTP
ncbi:MAG: hypothetical protein WD066_18260 [Planctomycetaceae bacterium]